MVMIGTYTLLDMYPLWDRGSVVLRTVVYYDALN